MKYDKSPRTASNDPIPRTNEAIQELSRQTIENIETFRPDVATPIEAPGDWELSDIINVPAIQEMMDKFCLLTRVPVAIIDLKGKILVATGWQEVCTNFHRRNPITLANCIECDTVLSKNVPFGTFKSYLCKNNLWDCVTPLMIGDRHVGNLFTGQFFYEGEKPDDAVFRAQAEKYGFDVDEYMAAVGRVPVWKRETINLVFGFYSHLANMISSLSHGNIALARMLEERKRVEVDLRESEERYRAILDNSLVGIGIAKENTIIYLNNTFKSIFGLAENETSYANLLDYCAPESRPLIRERMEKVARSEYVPPDYEYNIVRKDGQIRTLQAISNGILIGGEKYRINMVKDVTEQKHAEEEIRKQSALLRNIIDTSTDYIFVKDRNLRTILCNKAFATARGKTTEEFFGKTDVENGWDPHLVKGDPEKGIRGWEDDDRDVLCGKTVHLAGERANVGDEINYFDTVKLPLRDDRGEIIGILAFARDITDRKLMEEERIKTQRLESIGLLAGGIAHDFNNILMGITGNLSLLRLEIEEGDNPMKSLKEAERAAIRAGELTRQLLTFSRGGAPIKRPTSIRDLVAESVDFVRRGTKVKCDLALDRDLYNVEADEGQLSQVINNIVINAIQSMPEGGNVVVAAENRTLPAGNAFDLSPGDYVCVSFVDNGPGIDPKILPRIFEPYFTTKEKGTGLGLATSYSIVSRHGGKITAWSEPGRGSVFSVYLPASKVKIVKKEHKTSPKAPNKGRILIMDDEKSVRDVAIRMLNKMGFDVDEAADGREAVDKYKRSLENGSPYSAVIMDLTVPGGMGGEWAIKELVKIDPAVKAIVASGYSEDPVMANYKDYHFSGTAPKPYSVEKLSQILSDILEPGKDR